MTEKNLNKSNRLPVETKEKLGILDALIGIIILGLLIYVVFFM